MANISVHAHIAAGSVVEPGAVIGDHCIIGPFCLIGKDVVLSERVIVHNHVSIVGRTRIGTGTEIFPFAALGGKPLDKKYKGEDSELIIGCHNQIREQVSMHPGTTGGGLITQVGDHGLFMVGAHVSHDCKVGHGVIMVNNSTLGGHVTLDDYAILGGHSAV
ncbi:MAG: acyl-[acyl-carrier-protein]--UDP-N-acetylglucosamine O-acyltransferase, partial [Alphaproteobacteria bacterium]|nr:acyl-[acyl-carrier-protein]--UDP-N-acetylglucosamine O-acyltransferase [Alphaproteobacteria bacterium]